MRSSDAKVTATAALETRARGHRSVILASKARRSAVPVLGIATLVVLTAWVFRRQLFDHWSFPWDFLGSYSTTPAFVAATIGRGHPLSWSPFVASGFPVDVDLQAGVYFPVWWVLGALRVPPTVGVLTGVQIVHVPLGAIGVMLLVRARRQSWPWAVVAAVAYVFFGGFYGQAEHADIFRGFAYLPWLLWALTPPEEPRAWTRLAAVPLLAWLIVTGAYAGQAISFAIAGLVYLVVALLVEARLTWRRHRTALLLTGVAAIAVSVAIVLPYLRAEQAGELIRTDKPTAAFRGMFAISPLDAFGLYLNNFAWTFEGTITTWAIGTPIVIGLACARRATLARQAPLVACGVLALTLAMIPKSDFIGRGMTSLGSLFTSRFPAADYKAIVALVLIILSVDAWSRIATRERRSWIAVVLVASVLVSGIFLVPRTHAQPTRELWLVVGVILASCILALAKPSPRILVCALVVFITIDGVREINDYLLGGQVSPWQDPPSELAYYRHRDQYVRALPGLLTASPPTRPARVAASPTPEVNASGWVAEGYRATDYDPVRERALWEAEANPEWLRLLLSRWLAVTFPCTAVGCSTGAVRLPSPRYWHVSPAVHTISYGADRIVYSVAVSQPTLMVENELAIAGWHANTRRVGAVKSGTPLRAWRLSPGNYQFTASFQEPGRSLQWWVAVLALVAWLSGWLMIRRTANHPLTR